MFLTQWVQDEIPINNGRLIYLFQGLTADNKYFVFMGFPVSAEGLPESDDVKYPEKYRKLDDSSAFMTTQYKKLYKQYALEIARKLDKMPPEKFEPNLSKIESLINSLKVK